MNISALKSFAPTVRHQLMEAVGRKLDFVLSVKTPDYLSTYATQVASLRESAEKDRAGLIERVAYTWFNRFAALRYIDARGWHPFRARVLTAFSAEETQPEILKLTRNGSLPEELTPHTNPARLNDLLDGRIPTALPDGDPQGEVYRHLVLAACRFYHAVMPNLFEKLDDETELLLPDDLLTDQSVLHGFRTEITDGDCSEVEVLGWLYQFYISKKKDAVLARKGAVPSEDIPAVTQLFTPHWIVRYLLENSLGRLWLLNRPNSRLREQMPYYVESEPESEFLKITKPEEIRVLDPAVGSGHMLSYAFDLLYAFYQEDGYAPSEIAGLILTHNLYGIDICPRAAQLASLALVLKAREKSRRFFQCDQIIHPHVMPLQNVQFSDAELRSYFTEIEFAESVKSRIVACLHQFESATTFGSLIRPVLDEEDIGLLRTTITEKLHSGKLFLERTQHKLLQVLDQCEILTPRYQVVITNPPYQEQDDMNPLLREFVDANFSEGNTDLCCAFMFRNLDFVTAAGYVGMITMQSWMFLIGSAALRDYFTRNVQFNSMLHLGSRAFDSIPGEVVQTTAFICESRLPTTKPKFFRLVSGRNEAEKEELFLKRQHLFDRCELADFRRITGAPFAYWAAESVFRSFEGYPAFSVSATPCQGLSTGDTSRFLRYWHEVSMRDTNFSAVNSSTASNSGRKWFPIDKGGPPRRWFGNNGYVVNWSRNGQEIRSLRTSTGKQKSYARNSSYYFEPGVTWTKVSSGPFAARYTAPGFIFSDAGMKVFADDDSQLRYITAFLNSSVANYLLGFLSETINYEQGNLARLPLASGGFESGVASDLIDIAREDWDLFETSWDFREMPLLSSRFKADTVEASWRNWGDSLNCVRQRMRDLETKNNRFFIEEYSLHNELAPEIAENQITLACSDKRKDMVALLSYAVGCMMGRYSLDKEGLVLVDTCDTVENYLMKVSRSIEELTFIPDQDGIIPVLEGEWFEDDVVARTREFLRVVFGEASLRENIKFIEESLGKDLRKYFLTDFYKNHISNERAYGYKKRPIYWMVQSPKKGFNALIYLHRYTRDTMNIVLNRYLRPYQDKLRSQLTHLADVQVSESATTSDKTKARKDADKLTKILRECEEWERNTLLPLAQARIELDLDDGVKVNYQKLGEALAPISGLAAAEE